MIGEDIWDGRDAILGDEASRPAYMIEALIYIREFVAGPTGEGTGI